MVNRTSGDPSEQLRERHEASDFDAKTQDTVAGAQSSTAGRELL
jgi:GST-like protein